MKVVLHIDRLLLRGVSAEQRDAVVRQLQAALAREFAVAGVAQAWAASGHRAQVRARWPAEPQGLAAAAASALAAQTGGATR